MRKPRTILSRVRLPFRHSGDLNIVAENLIFVKLKGNSQY